MRLTVGEKVKNLSDEFTIVAVFDSPIENLKQHAQGHQAPFSILADKENRYYKAYGIEYSVIGMLKGVFLRFPTLIKGLYMGYISFLFKGRMTTMPANFLIDRHGIIQSVYYERDEGDHLPFDQI